MSSLLEQIQQGVVTLEYITKKQKELCSRSPMHCGIDHVLPDDMVNILVNNWPMNSSDVWWKNTNSHVKNLQQIWDITKVDIKVRGIIATLQSGRFTRFISELTGIPYLVPDPYYHGGGLNMFTKGGYLQPHVDFNFNKNMQMYRRVNLILYLNEEWKPEWGGNLCFWDRDTLEKSPVSYPPIINTAAVFIVDDTCVHGFEEPVGSDRKCLNLYWYTVEKSDNHQTEPHRSIWFKPRDTYFFDNDEVDEGESKGEYFDPLNNYIVNSTS